MTSTAYIQFKHKDGRTFRIPNNEMPGNANIQRRFTVNGKETWHTVEGPNDQIRLAAFDAISELQ
jgi:hypothetical protein